jgi:IS1 family transposase
VWISGITNSENYEIDEMYWFVGEKSRKETRENIYLILMISRKPRQIVGYALASDKSPERIQQIVDSAPEAEHYCTDGYLGYVDVAYPGLHIRNVRNKKDTREVESINADVRHYIPIFARKSRCFPRKIENAEAIVAVFIDAYNKFGEAKLKYRVPTVHKTAYPSKHLHKYQELPFSLLNFL